MRKFLILFILSITVANANAQNVSSIVYPDDDGKLIYVEDERGNRIPDFSGAGYMGGGVAIPDAPVVKTLTPSGEDDTQQILDAIYWVADNVPLNSEGIRGAILLTAGTYEVSSKIKIDKAGIVIRGEGNNKNGTIIIHRGIDETETFQIYGAGRFKTWFDAITNPYVPVGGKELSFATVEGLNVGMKLLIRSVTTQKWVDDLGMTSYWDPDDYDIEWERKIVAIDSLTNTITLDIGLTTELNVEGGHTITYIGYIHKDVIPINIGIEDLILMSDYDKDIQDDYGNPIDEEHAAYGIHIIIGRNYWVRRVTGYFYNTSLVRVRKDAYNVTIEDCAMLDGVSRDTPYNHNGGKDYSFDMSGHTTLCQRNYSRNARHSFIMSFQSTGNVVLDCFAEQEHLSCEAHQGWQTGSMYDNTYTDGLFKLNRYDGVHGQRAANCMLWNVTNENKRSFDPNVILDAAPNGLGNQWAIGVIDNGSGSGIETPGSESESGVAAFVESVNEFVEPRSLYLAQLRDRLGDTAVANIISPEQEISCQAVWDKMNAKYDIIPEFGHPDDLRWMPDTAGIFDVTPWVFRNNKDIAAARLDKEMVIVSISEQGEELNEPQLLHKGFAFVKDVEYELTFNMYAKGVRTVEVKVNSGIDTTVSITTETIDLNTNPNDYSIIFTPDETEDNARLIFNLGGSDFGVFISNVEFQEYVEPISVNEIIMQDDIKIYPNPTTGMLHISQESNWEVFNILGENMISGEGSLIDMSSLKDGMYLIKVNNSFTRIMKAD